ncbi:porin [Herbaspirillum seropedicae]|uniref:porin n=1 Tax=Herbaspirillum seropedicae TaxID=964 RepID=UPI003D95194C
MFKKTLAVCTILLLGNTAWGQSNVTLYGIIDAGIGVINNQAGKSVVQVQSGWVWGSRLGFKGVEDLGGGSSALFVLENGFDVDTGALSQGGRLFGRQSFVGLSNKDSGTITMGKQYDPVFDTLSGADITVGGGEAGLLFAHPFDNDNTLGSITAQNSVKYTSQKMGGFTFNGMYAFGETAGAFATNRLFGGGVNYNAGPLTLGMTFERISKPGANIYGAAASDQSSVASGQEIWGVGARYLAGPLSMGAAYTSSVLDTPVSSAYAGTLAANLQRLKFQNIEINAKYQLTPAFSALGMYAVTLGKFNTVSASESQTRQQFAVMLDYFLSKRTDLYFQTAYQYVSGSNGGGIPRQAQIVGAAFSSGPSQAVLRIGLKHSF